MKRETALTRASAASADAPTTDVAVRTALGLILASKSFAQAESLRNFLRYIVEATLEGRGDELKELALGSEVFGRGASYDPRIDPIVRVQATRLRSKLREYYQEEGSETPVRIGLPKGSYVPSFSIERPDPPDEDVAELSQTSPWGKRLIILMGAALAVAVVVGVVHFIVGLGEAPSDVRSIAVLPFADMSGDANFAFYGDGLAEEITTRLGSVAGLRVVPRTTAFQFKGQAVDLGEAANKLGVDAILQGSVREADDQLRVSVQLIDVRDNSQLWSQTFDRPASGVFQVQEEIARSVAAEVQMELGAMTSSDQSPDPRAYELYLRGRFEQERNTPGSIERSIELFKEAIEADNDFAPPYAGLVQSYALNILWGSSEPADTRDEAEAASLQALSLGGEQPEAVAARAAYLWIYEWKFQEAEDELTQAQTRFERNDELRLMHGLLYAVTGRREDALRELLAARAAAPNAPIVSHFAASMEFYSGDYDAAWRACDDLLSWAPGYVLAHHLLFRIHMERGELEQARTSLDRFQLGSGDTALARVGRIELLVRLGQRDEAAERLAELQRIAEESFVPPAFLARAHLALGETQEALDWVERGFETHTLLGLPLGLEPAFVGLREEPRFQALLAGMRLN